jgi:hypothetical protein
LQAQAATPQPRAVLQDAAPSLAAQPVSSLLLRKQSGELASPLQAQPLGVAQQAQALPASRAQQEHVPTEPEPPLKVRRVAAWVLPLEPQAQPPASPPPEAQPDGPLAPQLPFAA